MKGPNEGQQPPDSSNTIGSAAAWTPHGELLQGGSLGCKGVIVQGFLGSGSLSRGTQLELFYTAAPLNKFVWCMSCRRLCSRKTRVDPEGQGSAQERVCVCGKVAKRHLPAPGSHPLPRDSGSGSESLGWWACGSWNGVRTLGSSFSLHAGCQELCGRCLYAAGFPWMWCLGSGWRLCW